MSDGGRIISFAEARKAPREGPPLLLKRHDYLACQHDHVKVYETQSRIDCADCGAVVEPMEVMRRFARQELNFWWTCEQKKNERDKLLAEVEALKCERARLRRAIKES